QSISLAELIAGATAIDYADLDSEPFVAGGVLGEDNPDAKFVYDASQAPFNNGDGRYAVAYKVTVPEGDSIIVYGYAYSFVDGTFDFSSVFQIYKDGNLHIDGSSQSYILTEAGTYTLVVAPYNSSPTMRYGLTVIKPVPIVAVSSDVSSIDVLIGESVVDALYNQVTLTGTKENGGTVEFHSYGWSENSADSYVYTYQNGDMPNGYYLTDDVTNTAQVAVIHPALTVDDVITLPYSQTLLFDGSSQIINGKQSVVLQFTLVERTSLKFTTTNLSDNWDMKLTLLYHNKDLCASMLLDRGGTIGLEAGTYYIILNNDDYSTYIGDNLSATFSVDSAPMVAYTDLVYTPLTLGTPATGKFDQLTPMVLNPGSSQKGAGYSFNVIEGHHYHISYKLVEADCINMTLFLLKGNLNGNPNEWNGDRLTEYSDVSFGKPAIVFNYEATETGTLRLLLVSSFPAQEVSYTVTVTETASLSDLIAGATAIDVVALLDSGITKSGTFGVGEAASLVQEYSSSQFNSARYAAAWTVELTEGDHWKLQDIRMDEYSNLFVYWQNGSSYNVVASRNGGDSIDMVAPHTGTYIIIVSTENDNPTGNYSFHIDRPIPVTTITAITPSRSSIALNYGATQWSIQDSLNNLTLEGATLKGPVSLVNTPNNWSINGDTATYTPTSAPEDYQFAAGVVATVTLDYPSSTPIVLPYHETHKFIDLPKIDDKRTYVFEFPLTRKAKVNISVNATDGDLTVLNYELFDANRSKINSERWVSSFEEPNPTPSLPAGSYYLLISDINGSNRLFDFNITTTTVYSFAELVAGATVIDETNLSAAPFTVSSVVGNDASGAKYVSDNEQPFNSGDGRYAVAYQITVPEGNRVNLNVQGATNNFAASIYKDSVLFDSPLGNFGFDLTLTAAGTYTLVFYSHGAPVNYTFTVSRPEPIVVVSASVPSVEVPIGKNAVDVLRKQVLLTGTGENGETWTFFSTNWQENVTDSYVYDPHDADVPFECYFAANVTVPTVTVTHPAFVVDKVITLPHSENLKFNLAKQVINGKRSVVWQFTLTERTRLKLAAKNFSDTGGYFGFTLLDLNKNPERLFNFINGEERDEDFDTGTYYLVLDDYGYSANGTGDFSATFSINVIPMAVYTELDYAPLTFRTPATGSFNPLSQIVITPDWGTQKGAGYQVNTTKGNRYSIVYTLTGNGSMSAYLCLLNGGSFNGNADNWNGDRIFYRTDSRTNTATITVDYDATETGILRLLPFAANLGASKEASYTIEVIELISLPVLLAQAATIPYGEPLSFSTNGAFTEQSLLVKNDLDYGFSAVSGASTRHATAYKIDLPVGVIKISLVDRSTEEAIDPYLYLYKFDGTTYECVAFDDDGGGNSDAYIEYEIEEAGTYYIVATTYRKQTGIYTLNVWNTPEITDIDNVIVSSLFVSPNPATDYITINGIQTGETIYLINLSGKTVLTANTATINVSNLPNGVYLVRVGSQTLKFVKKIGYSHSTNLVSIIRTIYCSLRSANLNIKEAQELLSLSVLRYHHTPTTQINNRTCAPSCI
ncbi:MAG: T9SS type A sorting domain-containing protein, partial [Candidatus Symbiothrix sp.]|nr:T9SS type A sorting domain-containing protein [Candidatus Symbiothrix sp.]